MHIQYSCCTIILCLWSSIADRFLMILCLAGQKRSLSILLQITISLLKNGITTKTMYIYFFRAHPNTEISKFINAYKSASSRLLKKEFPQIRQKLWKERFWSQSFCLLTTGGTPIEVLKKYIESQGEKERKRK